jgi:hypothetical protein
MTANQIDLNNISGEDFQRLYAQLSIEERIELDEALEEIEAEASLDDPVQWVETNFYIPELNGPIVLAEYQKRCLREALRTGPDGKFIYSTVVWSDIKKSAKSSITAAVILWMAHRVRYGQIQIVANDLKQADSRVGNYARRAVELNPRLRKNIHVKPSGYTMTLKNRTLIEAIPIDPTGEAGGNADMIVYSELWGANSKAQKRMWTEATLPPGKFGYSLRWVETYAGVEGESDTLEQLYENGVKNGRQLWPDLEAYANESARLFVLWNTMPRLPWQTPEYYASEAVLLTPSEFLRVHRNQWSRPVNSFVPASWVDTCAGQVAPKMYENEPLVVGIDAGTSNDSFVIVAVSVESIYAGDYYYRKIIQRFAYEWIPNPGEKIQYSDPINPETGEPEPADPARPAPETIIRNLADNYHVVEFVFDPYQLHNMANNLTMAGVGYFVEMNQNQGGKRPKADKNLFDLIRDKRIVITDDRVAQHIKNANAKTESDGLRLVKRNSNMKIDFAVALSMACYEALELNLG